MSDGPSKEEKMDYDLDELERLEKAATAGPWCERAMWDILRHAKKSSGPWDDDENGVYPDEDDAKFVVATRNALPAMIRDLRLSCLGNGELPGNSDGNMTAREALKEPS